MTKTLAAGPFAKRLGRDTGHLAIRTMAGAVAGIGIAMTVAAPEHPEAGFVTLMDAGLARLERLPLQPHRR